MDEFCHYTDQRKIHYFYYTLGSLSIENKIPSQFVLNLDEEGHEYFANKK